MIPKGGIYEKRLIYLFKKQAGLMPFLEPKNPEQNTITTKQQVL